MSVINTILCSALFLVMCFMLGASKESVAVGNAVLLGCAIIANTIETKRR